jgi:hypothetical protein
MGFGTSSTTNTPTLTKEQQETIALQNAALRDVFMPAYRSTVEGAGDVLGQTQASAIPAAQRAMDVAGRTGNVQEAIGVGSAITGAKGLSELFGPQYEEQQVQAALQSGRESAREAQAGQNAMYGAAGGLGGARMALADTNLASLNAQRQATAAATARAGVQANKAAAAQSLLQAGQTGITGAQTAAAGRVALAGTPQDIYSKYAQVVFGTPQASTVPSFAGTQGGTSQGKGYGVQLGK